MLLKEAEWIQKIVMGLHLESGARACDIGSCSESFRCLTQPYVDYYVFKPLRKIGVQISYWDAKKQPGVDFQVDLTKVELEALREHLSHYDLVIAANLLEHVVDRTNVIKNIYAILKPGGHLIVTVPQKFPYHAHPIDTLFRPSPQDLVSLFPEEAWQVVVSKSIEDTHPVATYSFVQRTLNGFFRRVLRSNVGVRIVDVGPYQVSCAVLKKSASSGVKSE